MSAIVTFYSYKGGVGRTMALANVAVLLSQWGKKVLMVDWDLEAPGLEHFFLPEMSSEPSRNSADSSTFYKRLTIWCIRLL